MPKMTRKSKDKHEQAETPVPKRRRMKKISLDVDSDTSLESHASVFKRSHASRRSATSSVPTVSQQKQIDKEEEQWECLVCLEASQDECRVIFDCGHSVCEECYRSWEQVSHKCPVCNEPSKTVVTMLDKSFQVKELTDNNPQFPACQHCHSKTNPHMLYLCDACQLENVHTYCEPSLHEQVKAEFWLCSLCQALQRKPKKGRRNKSSSREITFASRDASRSRREDNEPSNRGSITNSRAQASWANQRDRQQMGRRKRRD